MFPRAALVCLAAVLLAPVPRAVTGPQPATDEIEPLPRGPTARLGSHRFRHAKVIDYLGASRDGKRLVTVTSEGDVRVWAYPSGKLLHRFYVRGNGLLHYALSPDGRALVVTEQGVLPRLIDIPSAKVRTTLSAPSQPTVPYIAFTGTGKGLVGACADQTILIWDLARPGRPQVIHTQMDLDCPFVLSARAPILGWRETGNRVELWDYVARQPKARIRLDGDRDGCLLALADDGKRLATGGSDGSISVWDVSSGKLLCRIPRQGGDLRAVQFGPGGRRLVSAHEPGTLCVWRLPAGDKLHQINVLVGGHLTMTVFPDKRTLALVDDDATVRFFDLDTATELRKPRGPRGGVQNVAFLPGARRLLAQGDDGTVRLWDLAKPHDTAPVWCGLRGADVMAVSPDGKVIATAHQRAGVVHLTDLATGRRLHTFRLPDHSIRFLAFDGAGKRLVWCDGDEACVRELPSGRVRRRVAGPRGVESCAISRDGKRLATASFRSPAPGEPGSVIQVWNVATGAGLGEIVLEEETPRVLAFSPRGRYLAAGNAVFDLRTRKRVLKALGHTYAARAVAFSPDERVVAFGLDLAWFNTNDKDIEVFDLRTGEALDTLEFDEGPAQGLAFSDDGRLLASAMAEGTVLLWDAARWRQRDGGRKAVRPALDRTTKPPP